MIKKKIALILLPIMIGGCLVGCKAYDKPEITTITPSQTAFLIPLDGDSAKQAKLQSEDFLKKNMVAGKRVQIPHRWLKEGRGIIWEDGKYIPTAQLIIVERKPITRNWTKDSSTGTSVKDESIKAETKESIAFGANFNCTAQIDETDAVRFLYRYNNATLDSIMDSEIHSRITTDFVEQCSQYNLSDLLINKQTIMENIRKDVVPYFKDRGITITALGISGDFQYTNSEIQKSIDDKFKAEKSVQTAQADADAIKIQSSTLEQSMKLKELELKQKELDNQSDAIKKWDGKLPTTNGTGNMLFNIPTK